MKSSRPDVAVGERLYGYWPMSSDVLLTIGRATPAALTETSPQPRGVGSVYNTYVRVAADPGMPPGSEPYVSLVRPLFTTSFLIDDFLAGNDFFGAKTVLITSASSKTAMGLAHCLKQRGAGRPEIVGLTSKGNAAFVAGLGTYDSIVTYDAIGGLRAPAGAVVVDMAGRPGDAARGSCGTRRSAEVFVPGRVHAVAGRKGGDQGSAWRAAGLLLLPARRRPPRSSPNGLEGRQRRSLRMHGAG